MKEQIFEILSKGMINKFNTNKGTMEVAKEIASHFMEFMEWFSFENITYFPSLIDGKENMYAKINSDYEETEWINSNELYSYWLTNIKNK